MESDALHIYFPFKNTAPLPYIFPAYDTPLWPVYSYVMFQLVMSTDSTGEAFVESFNRLLPEGTLHDFQQILDLKGMHSLVRLH